MNTVLLSLASRHLSPILILLSLVVLYRGHNLPGGGFIGGLIAVTAVLLVALARGWEAPLRRLPLCPKTFLVIGLTLAMISGCFGLLAGLPYMTGLWLPTVDLPLLGKLKLGTPLLFDLGVYLAVIGFSLQCATALGKDT